MDLSLELFSMPICQSQLHQGTKPKTQEHISEEQRALSVFCLGTFEASYYF